MARYERIGSRIAVQFRLFLTVLLCAASASAAPTFVNDVYPVLQKAGCPGCHNHDGVASATRLTFPEGGASPAELESFGRSLAKLVDRAQPASSLLITKPTRRVAHAGGKRIQPGSPEEKTVLQWLETLANVHPTEPESHVEKVAASKPILRRLTHAQYNNTIRDLLGDNSRIAESFPPEDFVAGFRNQYESQSTSPLLAEAYTAAAEKLSRKAFQGGDTRNLIPCKPATASDAACRDKFLNTFGRRAFRRPLQPTELARYQKLFTAAATNATFNDGARTVVEAMLQSPNFLLRTENGLDPTLRPYETANRLSYFLWNTMPDEALLAAAESGALASQAGIEKAARRMLTDERARESMNEFLYEWLRFDRLVTTIKDRRTFPMFTPELAVSMAEETRRLFNHLIWDKRNFMEFYSADYSFLSTGLASLYGVGVPPREYERVTLPASTERAGILGQATFLVLTSKPIETSPTARGLFVREQFLCQEVPQPPPGVSTNLPALTKAKPQTNRERLGVHLSNESCASCHALIDPIGFGFEKFDAVGQRREKQKITFTAGRGEKEEAPVTVELDLDTTGEVAGIRESAFRNPRELGKILAASQQCQECIVKQVFRYGAGRHEKSADRVIIRKAFEQFRDSGFNFQEMLVALVKGMAAADSEGGKPKS
jgi:hypothetical protein